MSEALEASLCAKVAFAWAVTELERGETGRIEGRIGIGAPFAQVARLGCAGRGLTGWISGTVT